MYREDSEAVILRTYRLAEADKIVVFFSRKEGLLRGVARGARRLRSRFGAGLEPCTLVRISWVAKENAELVSIRGVEIARSHFELSSRREVFERLERMAALTLTFVQPQQADERLYRMMTACFEALGERPEAARAVSIYFELWLLRLGGFLPDLSACGACGADPLSGEGRAAVLPEGVLLCAACAPPRAAGIAAGGLRLLRFLGREGPRVWAERFAAQEESAGLEVAEYARRLIERAAGGGAYAEASPVREARRGG